VSCCDCLSSIDLLCASDDNKWYQSKVELEAAKIDLEGQKIESVGAEDVGGGHAM
jgi:hypothetical protein